MPTPSRRQPERAEQAAGVKLLRSLGAAVYVLGTTRRAGDYHGTMQTPGLPDVLAFLPRRSLDHGSARLQLLVWEVKAPRGRLRPEQDEFRARCVEAHIPHIVGNCDALIAWLIPRGYLRADQVPHYRAPTETEAP